MALVCGVWLWVCHFPMGILGQVWYLTVSIPDLCILTYFNVACILCERFFFFKFYCLKSIVGQTFTNNDILTI